MKLNMKNVHPIRQKKNARIFWKYQKNPMNIIRTISYAFFILVQKLT